MENFTPVSAIVGGLLIGLAATLTLVSVGRIAGISGIVAGVLFNGGEERLWRGLFVIGLVIGPLLYAQFIGPIPLETQAGPVLTILAGLLVGYGTRLGSGCTSGHGICGLARFSQRSVAATGMFMLTAIVTVFVVGLLRSAL